MDKIIKEFCRSCTSYLQAKVYKYTKSPKQTFKIPSARFHTVHIDIVGPLLPAKSSNNPCPNPYRYVFTCTDRTSRLIEAQPISKIKACSLVETFVNA